MLLARGLRSGPEIGVSIISGLVMNEIERESIILNSAWDMIDDMVNWAMFVKNDHTEPTNLTFKTSQHSRLFIILLGDFLSEVRAFKGDPVPLGLKTPPSGARPSDLTFIFHRIEAFAHWLEGDFVAPGVNLHAIDVVADLRVARYRYLKMCGDMAKHNLARLATNVGHLRKLLESAGHVISEQEAYLAVENFFEWFHRDIFVYHASQVAEFLNNIRWAMFEYLQPEFERSWHLTENATSSFAAYSYRVPTEITEPVARAMYWNLMNRVRAKPWLHQFVISESFKQHY
jgi:hypothetical protein